MNQPPLKFKLRGGYRSAEGLADAPWGWTHPICEDKDNPDVFSASTSSFQGETNVSDDVLPPVELAISSDFIKICSGRMILRHSSAQIFIRFCYNRACSDDLTHDLPDFFHPILNIWLVSDAASPAAEAFAAGLYEKPQLSGGKAARRDCRKETT